MFRLRISPALSALVALAVPAISPMLGALQSSGASSWTFAVSGDSRNCGDFVMPALAAKVQSEKDAFYWHLGDFRAMSTPDQDLLAMRPAGNPPLSKSDYQQQAWDDFIAHQMAAFGSLPVFLGRGNHEAVAPMTREGYVAKFSSFLNRPEIAAQRKSDGDSGAAQTWFHFVRNGVDFITLDNASRDELSDAQLHWLRAVLDRDLAPNSGVRAIVAGMHEALPHSTGSIHAMDDWALGLTTGEKVYGWFYSAQTAGKHVYIIASHSHYYSPNVFNTPYWNQRKMVMPGWIIGLAGAFRYKLPPEADKGSRVKTYGYLQGTVGADGAISFALHELSENDLLKSKWPNAPQEAVHECYINNFDTSAGGK